MQEYFADERKTILCDFSTLEMIEIAYGQNKAVEWLVAQLTDLNTFCGVNRMRDDQTKQLAKIIYADYKKMKFSEIMLFFFRFKGGHYGHFYGNVEPMVITCALKDFADKCKSKRQEFLNEEYLAREELLRKWCYFTNALRRKTDIDDHRRIFSVINLYDFSLQDKYIIISVTREQYNMLEGECFSFFSENIKKFFPGFTIYYFVMKCA